MVRLQFESTLNRLYGRTKELEVLQNVYNDIRKNCSKGGRENPQESDSQTKTGASLGPRFVLLEGMSGNGKTSLVHHFGVSCGGVATLNNNCMEFSHMSQPRKRIRNCNYIKGKFNEQHQKPYAAFAEAFEDLLSSLVKHRDREMERIRAIRKALQGDEILMEIMPSLSHILLDDESHDPRKNGSLHDGSRATQRGWRRRSEVLTSLSIEIGRDQKGFDAGGECGMLEQMNEFQFRFQEFVRAICKGQPEPLVLFLDDLQWADSASLELLKAVLGDSTLSNLFVIGAYRGQEIQEDGHPLRAALKHLEQTMSEQCRYQQLLLNDLVLSDLNEFVADSLGLACEKTFSLSEVIMRKTHGNIFHSKEFLKHLETQQLIRYDLAFYHWTWDVEEIRGSTNISDNVVDLVSGRIRQLPESAIWILKVCSCLWFSFDVAVVESIVMRAREEFRDPQRLGWKLQAATFEEKSGEEPFFESDLSSQSEVMQGLLLATEQGLLDRMHEASFKFAHDKIREATYGLIEEGDEKDRMHFVIGELLFRMYHSKKSQEWMLFSSVDQLNKISSQVHSPKLRLRLAEVNLEAGDRATSISAFLPAIAYLKAAIGLLGKSKWECCYELCLKLFSKLAALESSVGQSSEACDVIAETIEQSKKFEDKLPVLITKIESLSVQGKLTESLELAFEVLSGLGEHFPLGLKPYAFDKRVNEDRLLTARLLKKHTEATILSLPLLIDEKKQSALRILNLMVDPSFHTGQMSKLFLIINRMVRISLESGLGKSSGVAFALYGFGLNSEDGNRRENYRYGKLAVILQEKLMAREYDCRVLTYVYVLLNHWQEPLQKSLSPLLSAHSAGMKKGDIDYAFQAAGAYLTLYWYSGHDLRFGVSEAQRFMGQMKEYKQDKALTIYLPLFQCMLNMTGKLENATLLKGEAISDAEFEEKKFANTTLMSYQMQLAYYFGDMELAEELSTKLQQVSKSFNAHYLFVARLFFFGMIALRIAMDNRGKRQEMRHLKVAKRVIKEMEQWTRHGGLNCLHKLLILKAELQAYEFAVSSRRWMIRRDRKRSTDFENVRSAYETAINISTRTGFRNDAALASERASVFFWRFGDTFLAESFQSMAKTFYMEWGAKAKVEELANATNESTAFDLPISALGTTLQQTTPTIDHGKLEMSHLQLSGTSTTNSMFFSNSHLNVDLFSTSPEDSYEEKG